VLSVPHSLSSVCVLVLCAASIAQSTPPSAAPKPMLPTSLQAGPAGAPNQALDPQGLAMLAAAIRSMGQTPPTDSVATGTVHIEAGSRIEDGTVRILTRGVDYSREEITLPSGVQNFIYADGEASENLNGASAERSGELAAGGPSPIFPLCFLTSNSIAKDFAVLLVGTENIGGAPANHLKIWRTFAGNPKRSYLAAFSEREVWLDQTSGLPVKVSYQRRAGSGAVPAIAIAYQFSDYRDANGIKYPFHIDKWVNGTPWASISLDSVTFNTGLSEADFTLEQQR
jgi:hypothetical protein